MVKVDAIEGTVNDVLWYHYDIASDVLYLRVARYRDIPTTAEETDDGFILLRPENTEDVVGMTVVNWWKRFGRGELPDSFRALQREIEPWARQVAA